MKLGAIGLTAAFVAVAGQAPKVEIKVGTAVSPDTGTAARTSDAKHASAIRTPTIGFISGPGPLELRAILGTSASARLTQPLSVPTTAAKLFLAPSQRYALVEQIHDPVAVWALDESAVSGSNSTAIGIPGAISHTDVLAFSPMGTSAALSSDASNRIQILTGLPLRPVVRADISTVVLGNLTMLALSDDGKTLVTRNSAGQVQVVSNGASWRTVYDSRAPLAWSFIPRTHDLVINDSDQSALLLIKVDDPVASRTPATVATGLQADRLTVTRDGEAVVGFSSRQALAWTVELKTGIVTPVDSSRPAEALETLRDGHTFLLSSPTSAVSIVKVPDSSHPSVRVIHPGIASRTREGVEQ